MTTHSCIFPLPVLQVRPHCQHWYLQARDDTKCTLLCLPIARRVCSTHLWRRRWQHSCIYPLPGVWFRPTVSPWTGMCKPRMKPLLLSTLSWVASTHRWSRGWWHSLCLPSAHGVCQTHFPHWYRQDNYTLISTLCLESGVIPPLKQRITTLLYLRCIVYGVWGHPTSEEEDELLMYLPSTWNWVRPTQSLNWSVQRQDDNFPVCTNPV